MKSSLFAFAVAAVCAALLTPVVRVIAVRCGVVDVPGSRRMHRHNVPRLGGLAIGAAFLLPFLALWFLNSQLARLFFKEPLYMLGLGGGSIIVAALGALDDLRGVRAWHKLGIQTIAALVAFLSGYRIDAITLPGLGTLSMGIFAVPITVLWIVAVINALNLIDGLDGLAAGVAFFACVTNFVVSAMGANHLVMLVSASLGGAVLGFLVYNFNPATIFMGDSGSMLLGYVLATMSLLGSSIKSSTTVAILVPLVALGLPIIDTLFAMARRILERRPVFSPDKGHIHHRLLELGITHRRAVLILYGISVLCTASAIALSLGRSWQIGSVLLALSAILFGLFRFAGGLGFRLQEPLSQKHVYEKFAVTLGEMQSARSLEHLKQQLEHIMPELNEDGISLRTGSHGEIHFSVSSEPPYERRVLMELLMAALEFHTQRLHAESSGEHLPIRLSS
ncbi:MAG: undecaprenyl/decaprenyl-phosphate alpha-N-acetylglucosaminyl 1-phosphate transferase [Myxococcales bacterium]|nr:undecaprenyl/decaprenyl-phosphate alpha-N-acetylglucosaminyl 1-phosphate transferase [Myxococcales bacterium]